MGVLFTFCEPLPVSSASVPCVSFRPFEPGFPWYSVVSISMDSCTSPSETVSEGVDLEAVLLLFCCSSDGSVADVWPSSCSVSLGLFWFFGFLFLGVVSVESLSVISEDSDPCPEAERVYFQLSSIGFALPVYPLATCLKTPGLVVS